jgi:hypothetical protein
LEREQAMIRSLDRAMSWEPRHAPARTPDRTQEHVRDRQQTPVRQRLRDLAAALSQEDESPAGVSLRPRLHPERERDDYGMGF